MRSTNDLDGLQGDFISMQAQKDLVTSAMVDGEVESTNMPVDLTACRDNWALYHLIGDALRRDEAVKPVSSDFTARMSAALQRESSHALTPRGVNPRQSVPASRLKQLFGAWPGLAVAAAVASVVWVVEPIVGLGSATQTGITTATRSNGAQTTLMAEARPELDYASAHRQLASPIAVRDVSFMPRAD